MSGTLEQVDWNAELVQGDLAKAVQQLKQEPGRGLYVGGVTLPLALADLGLIDEYEFVVQPILAGHRPTLFAGLSERLELKLVGSQEFPAGASLCVTSPVESGLEVRLPLGTRAWQLRHAEVDTGVPSDVDRGRTNIGGPTGHSWHTEPAIARWEAAPRPAPRCR